MGAKLPPLPPRKEDLAPTVIEPHSGTRASRPSGRASSPSGEVRRGRDSNEAFASYSGNELDLDSGGLGSNVVLGGGSTDDYVGHELQFGESFELEGASSTASEGPDLGAQDFALDAVNAVGGAGVSSPPGAAPGFDLAFDAVPNAISPAMMGAESPLDMAFDPAVGGAPPPVLEAEGPKRPKDGLPWPTGTTPEREQIELDPLEVSIAAGYGRPPESVIDAPMYAIRVFTGRRMLRADSANAEVELKRAEARRDDILVTMAREVRPALEKNDRLRIILQEVLKFEALSEEREGALREARSSLGEIEGDFDGRLARLQTDLDEGTRVRDEARSALEHASEALRRLEAKRKRFEIEKRPLVQKAREILGPSGGAIPPELARPIWQLEEQIAAVTPLIEEQLANNAEIQERLEAAENEVRTLEGRKKRLEREKRGLLSKRGGELDLRSEGLEEAERHERDAWAEVGRKVLGLRGEVEIDEARLKSIRAAEQAVVAAANKAEKLRRGFEAYDAAGVRRGQMVLGVAAGVLLVLLVLAIVR